MFLDLHLRVDKIKKIRW